MNAKCVFAALAALTWSGVVLAEMPTGGICAHRGDRASFPENTVPAFLAAVSNGAAMVEFDVHPCKTGELIVMHDDTIDRTTTGHGRRIECTFDYLRSVDAGIKRGAQFAGTKIPTFDEAIDCFPMDGVWLNVHCEDSVTDEVARKIKAKGRLHQAFIATGLPGIARARAAVPEIKTCLFAAPADSWHHAWTPEERRASIDAVRAAKAEFMQPHNASFEPEELYAYHAEGGKVNFFWCNKPSKLAQLLARGVDFPLTDNLKPMVAAYQKLRGTPCVPIDSERGFWYVTDHELVTGRLAPIRTGYRRIHRGFTGIPSVAVSPKNGRLWRTFYASPSDGEDSNNYVVLSTRTGEGPWEDVLVYDPDGDGPVRAFDPEVWIAPDGKLHWTWTERCVAVRDGVDNRWTTGGWMTPGEHLRGVDLDAENLPTAPYPAPRTLVQAGGVMMCKPIVARDGSWLYPVAFWNDDFSARIYRSTDGGKTLVPVGGATLPAHLREFEEHNVVELKDGTLRVYMRTKGNGSWNAWQADSHDGGRTWEKSKPCPFPQTNSRFFVRRLASGALLLVKNGSLSPAADGRDYVGREDMTAYVSDDEGATWKGGLLLHKGYCAYPDGDQAPDGTIYVTFDGDRFKRQEIFDASFTEADVRRGHFVPTKGCETLAFNLDFWRFFYISAPGAADDSGLKQDESAYSQVLRGYTPDEAGCLAYIDDILRGGVTRFISNINAQRCNVDSKVFEPVWVNGEGGQNPQYDQLVARSARLLHERGVNPHKVWFRRCRERQVEPWLSIRMNDMHGSHNPGSAAVSDFWRKHPEYRRYPEGTPSNLWFWATQSLDYSHEPVRRRMLDFIRECVENYDIDGIELDYTRFVWYFRPGREKADAHCLTEFQREVRRLTDAAAQRKGHPVRISLRLLSCLETEEALGLEVAQWAAEGLVDVVDVGCHFCSNDYEIPLEEWRKALGDRVEVIPHCDNGHVIFAPNWFRRSMNLEEYAGFADVMYAKGARGLSLFNLFGHSVNAPEWNEILVKGLGRRRIAQMPRRYPLSYRDMDHTEGSTHTEGPVRAYPQRLPANLQKGFRCTLPVGTIPAEGTAALIIGLSLDGKGPLPQASVNGSRLPGFTSCNEPRCRGFAGRVRLETLRAGSNEIVFEPTEGAKLVYLALRVEPK